MHKRKSIVPISYSGKDHWNEPSHMAKRFLTSWQPILSLGSFIRLSLAHTLNATRYYEQCTLRTYIRQVFDISYHRLLIRIAVCFGIPVIPKFPSALSARERDPNGHPRPRPHQTDRLDPTRDRERSSLRLRGSFASITLDTLDIYMHRKMRLAIIIVSVLATWFCHTADAMLPAKKMTTTRHKTAATTTTRKKKRTTNTAGAGTKTKKPTAVVKTTPLFLYDDSSQITEYHGDEETDFKQSRLPRIVQFYSPYCVSAVRHTFRRCGWTLLFFLSSHAVTLPRFVCLYISMLLLVLKQAHCVSFKSTYEEIARETDRAHPGEAEFYAVSCATFDALCTELSIFDTPVIHAFEADSSEGKIVSGKITRALAEDMMGLNKKEQTGTTRELGGGENEAEGKKEDVEDEEQRQYEEEEKEENEEEQPQYEEEEEEEQQHYEEEEEQNEKEQRHYKEEEQEDVEQDDDNPIDEPGDFEENVPEPDDDESDEKETNQKDEYDDDDDEEEDEEEYENETYGEPDLHMDRPLHIDNEDEEDPWFKKDAVNNELRSRFQRNGAHAAREKARARRQEVFSPQVRNVLKERLAKQQQRRSVFRRFPRANDGYSPGQTPAEGATDTMKAHTAHTHEWMDRRKKLLDAIEKRKGKEARMRVEKDLDNLAARRERLAVEKANLPYKKVVTPPKLGERLPIVKRVVKMNNEEALMLDTTVAFLEGLQQGLFSRSATLSHDAKLALEDWLQLLSVALPQEWGLHEAIDDLLVRKNYISGSRLNLQKVIEKHTPRRRGYSPSCSRSKMPFNCGFWKLLHTVTVGIAEHRGGLSLIDEGSMRSGAQTFSPLSAADTIRNYMAFFFPCGHCSKHFVEQYDDCENLERCLRLSDDENAAAEADWKELAKWLWEFHNSVSVRILHEKADGKRKRAGRFSMSGAEAGPGKASVMDEIAVLWPTVDACIKCYDNEGGWDEEAVFLHLEAQYWPPSEPDPKTARMLRLEKELDPSGPGLTILLLLIGIILFFAMRQSISKDSVQRALLVAKSVRTNAGMTQKRSD